MTQNNVPDSRIEKEILALSGSVASLIDNFRNLQSRLQETQEKVPQATDQLDRINKQTEAAAHQVLDIVEDITQRDEIILKKIEAISSRMTGSENTESRSELEQIAEYAKDNLNDTFMIVDALQFQDITSQQMNHTASLLEDVEGKLQNILHAFDPEGEPRPEGYEPVRERGRKRAFDPDADLFEKQTDQEDIDRLFETTKGR